MTTPAAKHVPVPSRMRRRWSVREFDRAAQAGIFKPGERLELIDGEILLMSPQTSRHAAAVGLAARWLQRVFTAGYIVRVQMPLTLGERVQPEPDVVLASGDWRDYAREHPHDASLIVEVADARLRLDQGRKAAAYARAGIREYWIVNLVEERLEVHRDPDPASAAYRQRSIHHPDDVVAPLAAPQGAVRVADLLP